MTAEQELLEAQAMAKPILPSTDDDWATSPLAVADAYFAEVKTLFPDVFDGTKKYAVPSLDFGWHDASTGKIIAPSLPKAKAAGYARVADGKREGGGCLERFLAAYWHIKTTCGGNALWACGVSGWFRTGILLGAVLEELGYLRCERTGQDEPHPDEWTMHVMRAP